MKEDDIMLNKSKKIFALVLSFVLILSVFCACSKTEFTEGGTTSAADKSDSNENNGTSEKTTGKTEKTESTKEASSMEHSKVKFTMANGGEFIVELYPEYAPETVANFLMLVKEGFYDGLTFHRVVEGFMAQGGDPTGTGSGGSKKTIKGEFAANGFNQNTLSHTRGVISMARSAQNDSASSQFFICYTDGCAALDGEYAAFGKVIEGMDVVDAFCNGEMTYNTMGEKASPVEPIIIKTATVVE